MSTRAARPALVIGLTGGIGSGKSTVAASFGRRGVPVIDADAVARQVVEPGQPALAAIAEAFGGAMLDAEGALDRAALRARVFERPAERGRLEGIVHPRIREAIRHELAHLDAPYAVVEIPLLVETGQHDLIDRVLVVEAPRETRIARAMARDGTDRADIERILAAQASPDARRAAADDIIDNAGEVADLEAAVAALHARYLRIARLPDGRAR